MPFPLIGLLSGFAGSATRVAAAASSASAASTVTASSLGGLGSAATGFAGKAMEAASKIQKGLGIIDKAIKLVVDVEMWERASTSQRSHAILLGTTVKEQQSLNFSLAKGETYMRLFGMSAEKASNLSAATSAVDKFYGVINSYDVNTTESLMDSVDTTASIRSKGDKKIAGLTLELYQGTMGSLLNMNAETISQLHEQMVGKLAMTRSEETELTGYIIDAIQKGLDPNLVSKTMAGAQDHLMRAEVQDRAKVGKMHLEAALMQKKAGIDFGKYVEAVNSPEQKVEQSAILASITGRTMNEVAAIQANAQAGNVAAQAQLMELKSVAIDQMATKEQKEAYARQTRGESTAADQELLRPLEMRLEGMGLKNMTSMDAAMELQHANEQRRNREFQSEGRTALGTPDEVLLEKKRNNSNTTGQTSEAQQAAIRARNQLGSEEVYGSLSGAGLSIQAGADKISNEAGAVLQTAMGKLAGAADQFSSILTKVADWFGVKPMVSYVNEAGNPVKAPASQTMEARATGGPVTAGKDYKVGEEGMEIFRPDSNGEIIPNKSIATGIDRSDIVGRDSFRSASSDLHDFATKGAGAKRADPTLHEGIRKIREQAELRDRRLKEQENRVNSGPKFGQNNLHGASGLHGASLNTHGLDDFYAANPNGPDDWRLKAAMGNQARNSSLTKKTETRSTDLNHPAPPRTDDRVQTTGSTVNPTHEEQSKLLSETVVALKGILRTLKTLNPDRYKSA